MITARCTLKCPFCYGPEPDAFVDLPPDQVETLLSFFAEKIVSGINFAGGEPFCYPQFSRIVKTARQLGFWLSLQTNGLEPDKLAPLLQELDWICLPIDGLTPETSKILRTSRSHFQHIKRCLDLIAPYRIKGLRLKIGTVITAHNINEISAIAEFLNDVRPDVWKWYEVRPRGLGAENFQTLRTTQESILKMEKEVRARYSGINLTVSLTDDTIKAHFIINPNSEIVLPMRDHYASFGRLMTPSGKIESEIWCRAVESLDPSSHIENARRTFPNDF